MAQKITFPSAAPDDSPVRQANRIEKTETGSGRYNYIGYTHDNRIDFEVWDTSLDLTIEEV